MIDEYTCEVCELDKGDCECIECSSCGENTKAEDAYQGRCVSCEDSSMVRGIY